MSPYAALGTVLLWVASIAGSYLYGQHVGVEHEQVKQSEVKQAIEDTRELARQGAADAIAKIKVRNTTIQGKVTTLVRDNPVYRDCVHDDRGLQLINEALTGQRGGAGRDGGGRLSGTDAPAR
jgi:hypothetical protein